ncbi:MAG TPA: hypothetical protein PKE45_12750 [Caldilineaceae bacterium]|nr:hypothetical protein [Caldilineaceae bacterium]
MSLPTRHLWLALLLVLTLALRLWRLNLLPPGFHFDEAFEGLEAWRILHDPAYRPLFLSGNFGVLPLNAYANALTFAVAEFFGGAGGPTTMRVTAALFGTLGVWAVYGLASELRLTTPRSGLSPAFPLWSAAALALMRWHLHFSRMGIEPILTPLIWAAATWLLLRTWRTRALWSAVGCGALLAAAMYAYQGAWVIPFLALLTALLLIWWPQAIDTKHPDKVGPAGTDREQGSRPTPFTRFKSPQFARLVLAALVALLCVAPLAWYFWNSRSSSSGWAWAFRRRSRWSVKAAPRPPPRLARWPGQPPRCLARSGHRATRTRGAICLGSRRSISGWRSHFTWVWRWLCCIGGAWLL